METRFSPIQIRPSWIRRQAGRLSRYAEEASKKVNKGLDKVGGWLFPNPAALLGHRPALIDGPAANVYLMESNNPSGTAETAADSPEDLIKLKNEILKALKEKRGYAPEELQILERSFDFMIRFHKEEFTLSGERIAIILLGVARTLAEWGCDPIVVSAGLLHLAPIKALVKANIDQHVIYLVHRMNVLNRYLFIPLSTDKLSEREARCITEMCLMQEGDRNVWLLKAAADFTTLSSSTETDKDLKRLASPSYYVTSKILSRINLDDIAVDLENIAFMRLDREEYERIEKIIEREIKSTRITAIGHLRVVTQLVGEELNKKNIKHRVQIDVKSVTRAKEKLESGDILTDASRFRFIIDGSREQCGKAMEIIKREMERLGHLEDLSERKNYIAEIEIGTIKKHDGTVAKSMLLAQVPDIKKKKLSLLFSNPREENLILKPNIEQYIKKMEKNDEESRKKLLSIISEMVENKEQRHKLLSILVQPPDGTPKGNKYESIHLHFRGEKYEPINVQIRTEEMHEVAEVGQASHGRFKSKLDGMIEGIVRESDERQKLIESGVRYGIYKGEIYDLVPYPPGRKIKIADLLVAISTRYVLRAPYSIPVRRFDPETGRTYEIKLMPKNNPLLENGDQILSLETSRFTPIRWNDLSTLPGQVAYRLAKEGTETKDIRSSKAAASGKKAIDSKLSDLEGELRSRMTSILKSEGENPDALEITTSLSIDLAAERLGAVSPEELYLKAGVIRRTENFVENVVSAIRSSSPAGAFKILEETGHADLWLLYPESYGVLPAILNLLKNRFRLISLSSRQLTGYSLIKARVKGRKRFIGEDAPAFLSETKDLHESSRHFPKEGKKATIRMEWRLGRLDIEKISTVAEILQKVGANIVSANFPPVLETRVNCYLSVEIPAGKFETFQKRLTKELKRNRITDLRIV